MGGTVNAPPGLYRFLGNLHVAACVTLQGSFSVVPSHDLRDGQNLPLCKQGEREWTALHHNCSKRSGGGIYCFVPRAAT